jgi:hypothetical protein
MYSNIINLIGNSIVANTILHARTPEKERGGKKRPAAPSGALRWLRSAYNRSTVKLRPLLPLHGDRFRNHFLCVPPRAPLLFVVFIWGSNSSHADGPEALWFTKLPFFYAVPHEVCYRSVKHLDG